MAKKPGGDGTKTLVSNKDARRLYTIEDKVEAGIVLTGTEVKSLRAAKASLTDAYVSCKRGEAYLLNLSIQPYTHGNRENHETDRKRKLLLHKQQIIRLTQALEEKGKSLIPLRIYLKRGLVKVELGLGKGKKIYDKRASTKEKEAKREMNRAIKRSNR